MDKERKKLLSVKDVAEWFGLNPMTIYRKARKGELPAIKFGKNWLFPEDELKGWMTRRCALNMKPEQKKQTGADNGEFAKLTPLLLVYAFGSVASGDETPQSDFDIAYLDDGSVNPFDFESELENVARGVVKSSRRIDLVRLNDAPASVRYKIIKTGNLLFARSDDVRGAFEDEAVREYLDYEPVLNKFYREVA